MSNIMNKTVLERLEWARIFDHTATEQQKLADEELSKANEMILAGDSTGDLLKDYVVVTTVEYLENFTKLLHETENLLIGNIGGLILFVYTWEEDTVKYVIRPRDNIFRSNMAVMKKIFLGIITDDKFVVNPQKKLCDFPTEHLIEYGNKRNHIIEQKTPGQKVIDSILREERDRLLNNIHPQKYFEHWEYKIGSSSINSWMKKNPTWARNVLSMSNELKHLSKLKFDEMF